MDRHRLIGVIGIALALRLLPSVDPAEDPGALDRRGLAPLATGVPLIVYGLAEYGQHGSLAAMSSWAPLVIGAVLVTAFVLHALRATNPLLNIRLFVSRAYSSAAVTTFVLGAGLFGGMLLMPLYFELVRGEDPVMTGLLLIPRAWAPPSRCRRCARPTSPTPRRSSASSSASAARSARRCSAPSSSST